MNRKDDHIDLALKFHDSNIRSDFDDIDFVHKILTELNLKDVDISTGFCGFNFKLPFHINGMTGGSDRSREINKKLGILARETGLFIASGSLSVALKDKTKEDSFKVLRRENKNGIIFANLGADKTLEDAKKAVDLIDADGIQIHINRAQELIMDEGEREFESWLNNISEINDKLGKPVYVKEVGFGMDRLGLKKLFDIGIKTVDISGRGGTNFARIENARRNKSDYKILENFGNSTLESLLESQDYIYSREIIASGGIRNSMDIVKSIALGARSVGISGRMLSIIEKNSLEEAIEEVNSWQDQVKTIMCLLGTKNVKELLYSDLILRGRILEWCFSRGIDPKKFGMRDLV